MCGLHKRDETSDSLHLARQCRPLSVLIATDSTSLVVKSMGLVLEATVSHQLVPYERLE